MHTDRRLVLVLSHHLDHFSPFSQKRGQNRTELAPFPTKGPEVPPQILDPGPAHQKCVFTSFKTANSSGVCVSSRLPAVLLEGQNGPSRSSRTAWNQPVKPQEPSSSQHSHSQCSQEFLLLCPASTSMSRGPFPSSPLVQEQNQTRSRV